MKDQKKLPLESKFTVPQSFLADQLSGQDAIDWMFNKAANGSLWKLFTFIETQKLNLQDITDANGRNLLFALAEGGRLWELEAVAEKYKFDLFVKDYKGRNLLFVLAENGHVLELEEFAKKHHLDLDMVDNEGRNLLFALAEGGYDPKKLAIFAKKHDLYLQTQDNKAQNLLFAYAEHAHISQLEKFAEIQGLNKHEEGSWDWQQRNILFALVKSAYAVPQLKMFAETHGLNLFASDAIGRSLLFVLAEVGDIDKLVTLAITYDNFDLREEDSNGQSLLFALAESGCDPQKLVAFARTHGLDIQKMDNNGRNLLFAYARGGHLSKLNTFAKDYNLDPRAKDKEKQSILFAFAEGGHYSVLEECAGTHQLDLYEKSEIMGVGELTLLDVMAWKGHFIGVHYLVTTLKFNTASHALTALGFTFIAKSTTVNDDCYMPTKDAFCATITYLTRLVCSFDPIHGGIEVLKRAAIECDNNETFRYLILLGCNPNQVDNKGATLLDFIKANPGHRRGYAVWNELYGIYLNELYADTAYFNELYEVGQSPKMAEQIHASLSSPIPPVPLQIIFDYGAFPMTVAEFATARQSIFLPHPLLVKYRKNLDPRISKLLAEFEKPFYRQLPLIAPPGETIATTSMDIKRDVASDVKDNDGRPMPMDTSAAQLPSSVTVAGVSLGGAMLSATKAASQQVAGLSATADAMVVDSKTPK